MFHSSNNNYTTSRTTTTINPHQQQHQVLNQIERLLKEYCSQTYTTNNQQLLDNSSLIDSIAMIPPNNKNNNMFGNMKNGNSLMNNSITFNPNQTPTNANMDDKSFSSTCNSGLNLSLNYNELTNMQYPQTNNSNNFNSSSHVTCSNNPHHHHQQTIYNNFMQSNNQQENMFSHHDLSNMFNRQNNNPSNMNNFEGRDRNQMVNNFNMNQNNQHAHFNVPHQHSMTGQYEPLVQSFSNNFQLGSLNQRSGESSLAIEDTCVSQFCSADALNKRKPTISAFQIQPNNSISNTIECTSSISPQSLVENGQNAQLGIAENCFSSHCGAASNKMQSYPQNNNAFTTSNNNDMHFNGEHAFEPSEDASSNEHVSSPKSGRKERVVASSVGKKVNGRYTKLRKQLRTFGGDFTDNYFVLDIAGADQDSKRPTKGGKKRKSSPTENESEEEILHNNRNHRSYTIHSSDYNNNIKMIPDMQSTSECVIDLDSRRRSSIGPISQSSTNPMIVIDSVNNTTSFPSSLVISANNDMSRSFSNPNITISPRSSNSRDITPQEEQTDNRSVQILLSLLMNSVNQQQQQDQVVTKETSQPFQSQSNPQHPQPFTFNNVNTRPQSNNPQNIANNDDFSFLNMLMRQGNMNNKQ